ncbi:MAG: class I SAM-dependent methyltransferase [Promethearchaeota archaeon]
MNLTDKCPICNSRNLRIRKKFTFYRPKEESKKGRLKILFTDFLGDKRKKDFFVIFCRRCGYIFLNPRFNEEEYQIIFKSEEKVPINYESTTMKVHLTRSLYNYEFLKKFVDLNPENKLKILDYGGASGYMLLPFLKHFECFLVDYTEYRLPKKIKYLGRNSNDLKQDIKFDVIFMLHVLEHVIDPKKLIKDLTENLKENGIISIQVPLGCLREWKSLDTPFRHINFFSEQSLYNCVRLAGLKVIYLDTTFQKTNKTKRWIINVIAKKISEDKSLNKTKFLSTKNQELLKFFYYIPYFLLNRTYNLKIIKKKILQFFRRRLKSITK